MAKGWQKQKISDGKKAGKRLTKAKNPVIAKRLVKRLAKAKNPVIAKGW